jgi:hypothetical protein
MSRFFKEMFGLERSFVQEARLCLVRNTAAMQRNCHSG